MDALFTNEVLRQALGARPFRFVEELPSTQDAARAWALEPSLRVVPPYPVVIAEHQTAGRGRQGRAWSAPPGSSILCSVILQPQVEAERLPEAVMAGAVAVYETLAPLVGADLTLKWPNDVLVGGRKLCGILAEVTWLGEELVAIVLGIGLNVHARFAGDLARTATSLDVEVGLPVNRLELLPALLAQVDGWAARIGHGELVKAWRHRLGTLGRRVMVYPRLDASGAYQGVAERVDEFGALFVRLPDGEVRRVIAADVGLWEG